MLQKLRGAWGRWRENSRQYKIDRALYRTARDHEGGFQSWDREELVDSGAGVHLAEPHTQAGHRIGSAPQPEQRSDAPDRAGRSARVDSKHWRIDWSNLIGLLVFFGLFVGLLVLLALTHWTGDLGIGM